MSTPLDRDCKDCLFGDVHCEHVDCWSVPPGCLHWQAKKPIRQSKKPTTSTDARKTASNLYYHANSKWINTKRRANKKSRNAYQRLYRDLDRDGYLLREKVYNDTRRKK